MSEGRSAVVVCGFGLRATPIHGAPSRLYVEGEALIAEHAKVELGPSSSAWRIETPAYRVPLPSGWTVRVGEPAANPLFELLGPDEASIGIRTSRRMPSIEAFEGPGQVFRDVGQLERAGYIEFEEQDGARTWLLRHEQLHRGTSPFVVTLRAPIERASAHLATLAMVVEGLEAPASAASA